MTRSEAAIVYDGECPFCSNYVQLLRLRDTVGRVLLVNAREGGPRVERLRAQGYDLDGGFVLEWEGDIYYGSDAINRLALLSTPSSIFNRVNALVFRSKTVSKLLYPVLRAGRNFTLFLMGRSPIAHTHRSEGRSDS